MTWDCDRRTVLLGSRLQELGKLGHSGGLLRFVFVKVSLLSQEVKCLA